MEYKQEQWMPNLTHLTERPRDYQEFNVLIGNTDFGGIHKHKKFNGFMCNLTICISVSEGCRPYLINKMLWFEQSKQEHVMKFVLGKNSSC